MWYNDIIFGHITQFYFHRIVTNLHHIIYSDVLNTFFI